VLKISIIVAIAKNNVIGKDNQLPWHLPEDLKHFKRKTEGHHLIMGRKTYESMGKPLPNRTSIVITRNKNYTVPPGHFVVHDLEAALEIAKNRNLQQVFVLGGAEIFRLALPLVDEMIITEIQATPEGNTFFPLWDESKWEMSSRSDFLKDEKNPYDYSFVTYQKRKTT
jgi:dihydrofolate reductase